MVLASKTPYHNILIQVPLVQPYRVSNPDRETDYFYSVDKPFTIFLTLPPLE